MYFAGGRNYKYFLIKLFFFFCGIYHTSKRSIYQIYVEYQSSIKTYLPSSLKKKEKLYQCFRYHCGPSQSNTFPSDVQAPCPGLVSIPRNVALSNPLFSFACFCTLHKWIHILYAFFSDLLICLNITHFRFIQDAM